MFKLLKRKSINSKKMVVLLTGASTGLGLEIAKRLISINKYHLILTARKSSLERFVENGIVENENIWIRELDVLSGRQRDFLFKEIEPYFGGVDILINNAGYMLQSVVEHVNESERLRQMDVNFRAPMSLIKKCLPHMRKNRFGKIINISSVSGMMAMPTMSIYSASKFALEGATEALWYEVKPWNIRVTLVQPGFINSDGFKKTVMAKSALKSLRLPHCDYFGQYQSMSQFIERIMVRTPATAQSVAKKVVKIVEAKRPPLRVSGTWDALLFHLIRRFLPRSIYHLIFWFLLPKAVRAPGINLESLIKKPDQKKRNFASV